MIIIKVSAFPKRIQNYLLNVKLFSVIYLDENFCKKAKIKTTQIAALIEKKRLEKAGFKVIEIKIIEKKNNVNDEININVNDEDVEQFKKDKEDLKL